MHQALCTNKNYRSVHTTNERFESHNRTQLWLDCTCNSPATCRRDSAGKLHTNGNAKSPPLSPPPLYLTKETKRRWVRRAAEEVHQRDSRLFLSGTLSNPSPEQSKHIHVRRHTSTNNAKGILEWSNDELTRRSRILTTKQITDLVGQKNNELIK